MGSYTEQELLLLSNFAYIPACLSDESIGSIIEQYRDERGEFTPESVAAAAAGGGMSKEDVAVVFDRMDKRIKENPGFGELSAGRRLEEADVRAICYTDPKDKEPVVVFRGTGGTEEAWSDNFDGAYFVDTRIQKEASDFLKYECGVYEDIVVTGHSKGGNMAMYVTVKNGESVSSCVSFDGQGFGEDFIRENEDEIKAVAPKIRSISAYNDYVNILLTSIAGSCIYLENAPSVKDAHSSVTLLTHNSVDDNGSFTSIRGRGAASAILDAITDRMCDTLEPLDIKDKEMLGQMAGSTISRLLCTPPERVMTDCTAPLLGMFAAQIIERATKAKASTISDLPLAVNYTGINTASCTMAAQELLDKTRTLERISMNIDRVRRSLAYTTSSKVCAEHRLNSICDDITGIRHKLERISNLVEAAMAMYMRCESEVAGSMST